MPIGTVEIPTFEWTVPEIKSIMSCYGFKELFSPECHLPDSSWKLKFSYEGDYKIYLMRTDSGPLKVLTCKLKSNVTNGVTTITDDFRRKGLDPVLQFHIYGKLPKWELVIRCYIESLTSYPKTESISRKFTTRAVQTEDSKDEDWSSLDRKDDTLLRELMKELLTKGIEHDVTICVQDKEFRAHRSILTARSPVFAMMLTHDSKENNTGKIEIEDCDPESFDEFLLYLYSRRTENLTHTNALRLYYPADKYDFPVLKDRCVRILKTSLSVESICDVVLLAAKHQEKELLELATEFFARNMKKILVTVNWQKFLSQNPVVANEVLIRSVDIKYSEK